MASLELGTFGHQNGTAFLYNFIAVGSANATVTAASTTQVTITPNFDPNNPINSNPDDLSITAIGTNFNIPDTGVVTQVSFNFGDSVEFTASGLSISVGDLETAIQQPDQQVAQQQLEAIFAKIDWQFDLSNETVGSLIFGSGGNDTIVLGSGDDQLMLDGGKDNLDAGGGDDLIYAKPFIFDQTGGQTTVTGGSGSDTFCLDYREFPDNPPIDLFKKGQTVELGKLFVTGDSAFKLVSIENIRGSAFNDSLTGSNAANKLDGEEGNDTLIGRGGADTITGGIGNDKLAGGADADTISGGVGNDKITGGAGADKLTGGTSDDDFIFTAVSDSAKQHDIITDFQHKHDDIDLSKLQPDTKNHKFVFIDDHKFGHHAGELQVIQHDNSGTKNDFTMVEADLDGNGKVDFEIELTHLLNLDKNDFIL